MACNGDVEGCRSFNGYVWSFDEIVFSSVIDEPGRQTLISIRRSMLCRPLFIHT